MNSGNPSNPINSINLLFYSKNCEGSKHLISLMQNENLIRFFHPICTDDNPKIPPQIKVTPVLIIKGVAAPYVAGDAFAWLSKIKQWKINTEMNRVSAAQQNYLQQVNKNIVAMPNDAILGFSPTEMEGLSDMFAYLQSDNPAPLTYVSKEGVDNIFTPPLEDGTFKVKPDSSKLKVNRVEQTKLREILIKNRNDQDKMFKQNIDNFINQYNQGTTTTGKK